MVIAAQSHSLAVIFDIDGVLIDSYDAHFESWQALAAEAGAHFMRDTFERTFGRTSRETLAEHWSQPLTPAQIAEYDDRKEHHYRTIVSKAMPIMDGALELIDDLQREGFRLGVGSSAPRENVVLSLKGLGRLGAFGAVITGADVTRGKPDPEVFLKAAERLGVQPNRCAVIEDAPAGIQAARAAGMTAIAMLSKGRSEHDFAQTPPDMTVHSLRALNAQRIVAAIRVSSGSG